MKRNKVVVLLVLVLLAIAGILILNTKSGTLSKEVGDFAIDDTASVSKIYMADMRGNEVLFREIEPGHWTLNDSLKARPEGMVLLLNTMSRLAVKTPISKSSHNTIIKRLATTSVKVEIYQMVYRINLFNTIKLFPHEKLTKVYYVGNATPDNMGSFMLMEGSDTPFVVYLPGFKGYVSARFTAYVSDWRDHTIFAKKPSQIRSIKIEFPQEPVESFIIEKSGDYDVKLTQLSTGQVFDGFDTTRVLDFINAYRNIRFESSFQNIDPLYKDSITSQVPINIIELTDVSGEVERVVTYRRKNLAQASDLDGNLFPYDVDRLYAAINDESELLIVQYFVFDPITRPLSFLLGRAAQ
jgi:hypothetical protein